MQTVLSLHQKHPTHAGKNGKTRTNYSKSAKRYHLPLTISMIFGLFMKILFRDHHSRWSPWNPMNYSQWNPTNRPRDPHSARCSSYSRRRPSRSSWSSSQEPRIKSGLASLYPSCSTSQPICSWYSSGWFLWSVLWEVEEPTASWYPPFVRNFAYPPFPFRRTQAASDSSKSSCQANSQWSWSIYGADRCWAEKNSLEKISVPPTHYFCSCRRGSTWRWTSRSCCRKCPKWSTKIELSDKG